MSERGGLRVATEVSSRLRLVGYEVLRFGGAELMHEEPAKALVEDFFTRLLDGSQPEHL